jgi:hypothetical protein
MGHLYDVARSRRLKLTGNSPIAFSSPVFLRRLSLRVELFSGAIQGFSDQQDSGV